MTITEIDLYNILRSKLGEQEAKCLVEFVKSNVEKKLEEKKDSIATKSDLFAVKAEMIKWMFIFWAGQTGIMVGILALFLK